MGNANHTLSKTPKPGKETQTFMLVVLFLSLFLALLILRPFIHTIIFSVILASLFHPIQLRLVRFYKGRRNAAALTVLMIIILLVIIPLFFFTSALIAQGLDSINQIDEWISEGNMQKLLKHPKIADFATWIREHLNFYDFAEVNLKQNLMQASKRVGEFLLGHGVGLMRDVASMVFHFFVMIFLTFYLVRDGQAMLAGIKDLSPLREDQENRIIDKIRSVARSALLANFLTAICQGAAGGLGLAIVGIPALFWGALIGISSLIPVVGTAIVWIPAIGYLTLVGRWKAGVFLLLWAIFFVGTMDNFLRPFLMRGKEKMSPFYLFLAIIGGVSYFGLVGILYGPLILGFAAVMLYIYQVEHRNASGKKDTIIEEEENKN
ncbi:MAG: AI-2E family transporter [Thermodesulfobacteriota bacterium]